MTRDEDALRTMIVDDEPLAIERMQVLCAELDQLQVVGTASDGEAALRLADKLKPDLMLLDMTMPGLDGLGVARQLVDLGAQHLHPLDRQRLVVHDHRAQRAFFLHSEPPFSTWRRIGILSCVE